jgi:uncharacterized protein involved in exopolysaccharide biosynthesis
MTRSHDPRYDDEVSLRDLYLILLRGLPAILAVAVLAGAAAWIVSAARPASYQAEALVTSSPPAVRFREDPTVVLGADETGASTLLALQPPQGIRIEAYRALALSQEVLARARELLGDAAPESAALRGAAEIEAASSSAAPLLVHHRLTWTDPETASAYANAWANATVEHVRISLVSDLEPTIGVTRAAVAERREALEEAEAALADLPPASAAVSSRERLRLEREVAAARRAYATIADLEPTLTYLAELVPSGTRVLDPAAPPANAVGPGTALLASLAAVVGAMVATLGVFLREAVRAPAARPEMRSSSDPPEGARTDA